MPEHHKKKKPDRFFVSEPYSPIVGGMAGPVSRIQGLIDFFVGMRNTLRSWGEYNRRTGRWPWPSILAHFLNLVFVVSGIIFILWWGDHHDWSRLQVLGVSLLIGLPYGVLWLRVKQRMDDELD
jgi:hypothetical protein